jgi:hypothetical protein
MAVPRADLLALYRIKRSFTALDEWLSYAAVLYLYARGYPTWLWIGAALYGALAIATAYQNLDLVEREIGGPAPWFIWPLWRSGEPPTQPEERREAEEKK